MNTFFANIASFPFWQLTFWGNTVQQYVLAFGIFLLLLAAIYIIRTYVLGFLQKLARKTKTDMDDTAVKMVEEISGSLLVYISLYVAVQSLTLHDTHEKWMYWALLIWVTIQTILVVQVVVTYAARRYHLRADANQTAVGLIATLIKILLWIIGLILILSNLGINVTSLVTGLGIGGVAIALAVQNVLGDLFGYFSIHFDQPFKEGDTVEIGGGTTPMIGTIEKIGIKTTRVRSLRGEQVVVPNAQLTSGTVSNFKRFQERRVLFTLALDYQISSGQLKEALQLVQHIIETTPDVRFDRVHFNLFGPSSLNLEVVYHVETSEYLLYMDRNQDILLRIKEAFEKAGIAFAYPTQTVYVHNKK